MVTLPFLMLSAFAFKVEGSGQIVMSTSYYGTVVLKDGVLEGWGSPLYMDPSYPNGITSYQLVPMVLTLGDEDDEFWIKELVSGGRQHCAVSEGGKARCWGQPSNGQLGTGNTAYYSDATNFGKDIDFGSDFVVGGGDCGYQFCCFLSTGNGLKCFGYNNDGQLGYQDTIERGDAPGEMGEYLAYVYLGSGFNATEVATGYRHSCALSQDKRVKCWGYNAYGNLGQGSTTTRGDGGNEMGDYLAVINFGSLDVPEDRLRCGYYHCCVVTQGNELLCWGYNGQGQLGLGHTSNIGDSSSEMGNALSTVKLGDDFIFADYQPFGHSTCVLSTSGKIKCFGYNGQGQLGYGHTTNMGTSSATIGNNLPYVDLANFVVAALSNGGQTYHHCAVSTNDEVKCWGNGDQGQLGIGTEINMGDGAGEMGNALSTVDLSTRAPTTAEPTTPEPTMQPTTICSSSAGMLIDEVLECSDSFSNIGSRMSRIEGNLGIQTTSSAEFEDTEQENTYDDLVEEMDALRRDVDEMENRLTELEDSSTSSLEFLGNVGDLGMNVDAIDVRLTRIESEEDDDTQSTVPVWFVEAVYVLMALNVVLVAAVVGMAMKWRQPVVYSKVAEYDSECAKLSEIVGQ